MINNSPICRLLILRLTFALLSLWKSACLLVQLNLGIKSGAIGTLNPKIYTAWQGQISPTTDRQPRLGNPTTHTLASGELQLVVTVEYTGLNFYLGELSMVELEMM